MISFNNRYFQLSRSQAVKNVQDAIIEIVTNSVDAYTRKTIAGNESDSAQTCPISIKLSNTRKTITVTDNAIGMTTDSAIYNLLNVGASNTDSSQTRGYFNRGAKDITALGTVTFTCLKDGEWCKICITPALDVRVLRKDEIDESEIAGVFGSASSGVSVRIDLLDAFAISPKLSSQEVGSMISDLFQLRSIFMNSVYDITLVDGESNKPLKLVFVPPAATLVDEIKFRVPGYEHVHASFQLFMTSTEIPSSTERRVQKSGVLIKSLRSDYDLTFFDNSLRYNKYSNCFYGFLCTDGVAQMLVDFDKNGPTNSNPQLVLDPNRGGINVDHPFVRQLYSIPKLRLKTAMEMRELNDEARAVQTNMDVRDFSLRSVEDIVTNLIKSHVPNYFKHVSNVRTIASAFKNISDNYITATIHDELQSASFPQKGVIAGTDTRPKEVLVTPDVNSADAVDAAVQYGELSETGSDIEKFVYQQVDSGTRLKIDFVCMDYPEQYRVVVGNSVVYIKINMSNELNKLVFDYDPETDTVKDISSHQSLVALSDIVADAITWIHLEHSAREDVSRDLSLLEGIMHGKNVYTSKKNNVKFELIKSLINVNNVV
jgi:hypothetical protein